MNRRLAAALTIAFAFAIGSGAAAEARGSAPVQLSGRVELVQQVQGDGMLPLIGIVSDSQIQTRRQILDVRFWRSAQADARLTDVTIRPPALDWSSRYLLEGFLEELRAAGARAIFFLGDGANNGCRDEFLSGFEEGRRSGEPAPNERGVLRLLDEFRQTTAIPVYFILGNHDFMAAGSTSEPDPRVRLCDDNFSSPGANRPLSRFEVIEAIDAFNRGNSPSVAFPADYSSNVSAGLRDMCLLGQTPPAANELRQQGCYYAAVLDYPNRSNPIAQLFLLDTTDNADVSGWGVGSARIESMRGAMSFRGEGSQTAFFMREADRARHLRLRLAFTHYPVRDLPKFSFFGWGGMSQRFLDLFVKEDGSTARPRQDDAFVISGHTHAAASAMSRRFRAYGGRYVINDLNVGSTTDSSMVARVGALPHAALVRLRQPAGDGSRATLEYQVVRLSQANCTPIYAALDPETWRRFGIVAHDPKNYRRMSPGAKQAIFEALNEFIAAETPGRQSLIARCIGLRASEIEGPAYRAPSSSR